MTAGTAVDLINNRRIDHRIYDAEAEVRRPDTMSGNAKADIMLGGVNNGGEDHLNGDRDGPVRLIRPSDGQASPMTATISSSATTACSTSPMTRDYLR